MLNERKTLAEVPPDLRLVKQDLGWLLATLKSSGGHESRVDLVDCLYEVWVVDANCATYICSAEPMLEAHYAYTVVGISDGATDDEREEIYDELEATPDEVVSYFGFDALDGSLKIETSAEEIADALEEHDGDDEAARAALLERAREYFTCNQVF